jgi:Tol biopolymer transport system component
VDQALADVATGPHARASSRVVTAVVGESPFRGTWVSRQGRTEPTPAILGYNGSFTSRLWQGRLLATSLIDAASNNPDIWTIDLVTGSRQRVFQSPETWDSHPRWSQDGESLLFRSGTRILIAKPGLGDAGPRVVAEDIPGLERVDDWSPDGRTALVSVNRGRTLMDIQAVDVATGLTHPFVASDANESFAMFSPDGTRVAYATDGSGTSEVYVQAFPSGATRRVSTAGGALPRWSADGRRLYFLSPAGWLMQSTVNGTRSDVTVSTPEPVVQATGIDFIPSSDDSRFLVFERDPQPRSIAIVNWPSLLPKHP